MAGMMSAIYIYVCIDRTYRRGQDTGTAKQRDGVAWWHLNSCVLNFLSSFNLVVFILDCNSEQDFPLLRTVFGQVDWRIEK